MRNISRLFILLVLTTVALKSRIAFCQSAYNTTCASGVMDSEGEVEETVCISGDTSNLDTYVEVDDNSYLYYGDVVQVSAENDTYDNDTFYFYGSNQSLTSPGGNTTASTEASGIPTNVGDIYTLYGWAGECIDPTDGDDPYNCSWQQLGSLSVQLNTAPPSVLDPAYKVTSILYPAPGSRSSSGYTNQLTDGATSTIGSSITTQSSTTYSYGGKFFGTGSTLSVTFSASSTNGNSTTHTETYSDATGVTIANNAGAPNAIDHTQDLFLIWLNPEITITPTGSSTANYTIGTQSDASGNLEAVDQVEVTAQTMIGANGVSYVDPQILDHQPDANGNRTLPGLASICVNLNRAEYDNNACTLSDQCGCTPDDFKPVIAQDPLLNYNGTVGNPFPTTTSPLLADTDGSSCAHPTSSSNCRYIPVPISSGSSQQQVANLSGPQCLGCSYPTNSLTLSDATTTTQTLNEQQTHSVGYSWVRNVLGLGFGTGSQITWADSESSGAINGHSNTQATTLSSGTVGCYEDIPVFEDTRFHTFVFQQPANNNSCP